DQITDITIEVEEPNDIEQENSFSIEEFIEIELGNNEAKKITREEPKVCNKNTKEIQELLEDLTRPLKPTESRPNLFLALTWEKQVENIIKKLQESRKSKKGRIGILEAHYYLGKLLKENISQHDQIKRQLSNIRKISISFLSQICYLYAVYLLLIFRLSAAYVPLICCLSAAYVPLICRLCAAYMLLICHLCAAHMPLICRLYAS